jgi:outer membrane protein OmpA-like peptidoglycan-associated protein
MVVTGYTDTSGDPQRNLELSQQRASAVVDYMVATGELDRTRFDAIGAGDTNPVADNSTPEGRTLNRRIDVKLVNLLG